MQISYRQIVIFVIATMLLVAILPVGIVKLALNFRADTTIENIENPKYNYTISVLLHDSKKVAKVDLEEYVVSVVASEMPANFELEALKAQAVAARTYAISKAERFKTFGNDTHPEAPLCDEVHCQVYRDKSEIEKIKGEEWMQAYWTKLEEAVQDTTAQVMTYQGMLVEQPLFHSSSGGQTENSEDVFTAAVPYLRSVESPYEELATHRNEKRTFSTAKLRDAIKNAKLGDTGKLKESNIKIQSISKGGSVEKIKTGKLILTGRQIRTACNLPSDNFTIEYADSNVTFISNGYGHGVGMSQWGADGMAKNGYTYEKILSHYYSGIELKSLQEVMKD